MTARPQLDERDPQPPPDWQPTSHAWARRQALEAAAAAVTAAKERRTTARCPDCNGPLKPEHDHFEPRPMTDRTTGAHSGSQGRETHPRTEVATTDGDAGQ